MKTLVLLYNTSCIYEIVILNYFLKFTGKEVVFASVNGMPVTSMEGYSVNVDMALSDCSPDDLELMVVPGGNITEIDTPQVWDFLNRVNEKKQLIAGICAGVDVLEHAGILNGIVSTHSSDFDVAVSEHVITSRANGYVDFAIEVARKLDLFVGETDLQETIAFWREHKRMQ